jgi:uncharacterized protein (TIGR01777 family)
MNLLCIGCTGFLGAPLRQALLNAGHRLHVVARSPRVGIIHPLETWISFDSDWMSHLETVDGIINLAGESIADGLWSTRRRERIQDTRSGLCRRIMDRLSRSKQVPKVWINASAVGFFGDRGSEELMESSVCGSGFLAETCHNWEIEVQRSSLLGVRSVSLRFGVILSPGSGFLKPIEPIFQKGLGTILGSGNQFFAWVAREDAIRSILFCLDSEIKGPVNVVAPHPIQQRDFAQALSQKYGKKLRIRIPAFLLRLVLGELSSLILFSQRVIPDRLLDAGFRFKTERLQDALTSYP